MRELDEILLQSSSGTEALRKMLEWKRQTNSKWSMAWIAQHMGLASKGTVGDFLSGRRSLSARYWPACIKLLDLRGLSARYCKALLDIEALLLDEETVAPEQYENLETLRKSLSGKISNYSDSLVTDPVILQVHSAFGLFKNEPTRQQLLQFFGRSKLVEVDRALNVLHSEGMLEKKGDVLSLKSDAQHLAVLIGTTKKEGVLSMLKDGMTQSIREIEHWSDHRDLASFRSAYIAVNREAYIRQLDFLRDEILRMQNEMSSSDGDMMVRLDYQIYPVGSKNP